MSLPKVSVLIPTYNCAAYLNEAIQSVLDQTFHAFELIIVDNHSTDNTTEVVRMYLQDPRIMYYCNTSNLGLVGNWNKCLDYANGEYIKFLCADDIFHPRILEKFVSVMEQFPTVSLVCCYRREFGDVVCDRDAPFQYLQDGQKIIFETLNDRNWLGEPTTVMFRRSNLKVGGFKPGYTWIVDWEMWLRQLTVGDCYIIPEYLSLIRRHTSQVTELVFKNYIHSFEEYELCKAVIQNPDYNFKDPEKKMNAVLKRRARQFYKIMIKLLPKLTQASSRTAFRKAFNIIKKENFFYKRREF